jgi:hypothetical protein
MKLDEKRRKDDIDMTDIYLKGGTERNTKGRTKCMREEGEKLRKERKKEKKFFFQIHVTTPLQVHDPSSCIMHMCIHHHHHGDGTGRRVGGE